MKTKEYPRIICSSSNEDDILFSVFRFPLKIDLSCAMEIVANRLDFAEHKKHYLVVDASAVRGITPEAKAFLQTSNGGLRDILGAAIVASNPVSALIANIFVKSQKNFQSKFFYTQNDALKWIRELKQKGFLYNDPNMHTTPPLV